MTFFPRFQITFAGGWWFSLGFLLLNVMLALIFPGFRKKALVFPTANSAVQKICMVLGMMIFQSRIIMAAFMAIRNTTIFFIFGTVMSVLALSLYVSAIITFTQSDPHKPVVTGIYRFSRNPQQLSLIIFWSGIGFVLGNYLFIVLGLLELLVSYPGMLAQEQYCLDTYGLSYREYMNRTPRYFLI